MKEEIHLLKIERKRNWKKLLKCCRGWNKLYNKYSSNKTSINLKKIRSKQKKYSIYLDAYLITNQRIEELENS